MLISAYIFITLGELAWVAKSALSVYNLGGTPHELWNLIASLLLLLSWIQLSTMRLAEKSFRVRMPYLAYIPVLSLSGPVLLSLLFVGSHWDAISYDSLCSVPHCVTPR